MASQLTIKSTRGEFKVHVDPSQTVAQLKAQIDDLKGCGTDTQRLIYKGKALEDHEVLETKEIGENDFILLLLTPPKSRPGNTNDPSNKGKGKEVVHDEDEQGLESGTITSEKIQEDIVNIYTPQTFGLSSSMSDSTGKGSSLKCASSPSSSTLPSGFSTPLSHVSGRNTLSRKDIADMIRTDPNMRKMFMEMAGKESPDLLRLLEESPDLLTTALNMFGHFGDVDMDDLARDEKEAVKRIMSFGFEEKQAAEAFIVADKNEEAAVNYLLNISGDAHTSGGTSSTAEEDVDIVQKIRDRPEMKQLLLRMMEKDQPELATRIKKNPALLEAALNEISEERAQIAQISLTKTEWEAVDRLIDLGFSKKVATEAYIACEKDQERAADFLFSNPEDPNEKGAKHQEAKVKIDKQHAMDCDPATTVEDTEVLPLGVGSDSFKEHQKTKVESQPEIDEQHAMDCDPATTVKDTEIPASEIGSDSLEGPHEMHMDLDLGQGSSEPVAAFEPDLTEAESLASVEAPAPCTQSSSPSAPLSGKHDAPVKTIKLSRKKRSPRRIYASLGGKDYNFGSRVPWTQPSRRWRRRMLLESPPPGQKLVPMPVSKPKDFKARLRRRCALSALGRLEGQIELVEDLLTRLELQRSNALRHLLDQ